MAPEEEGEAGEGATAGDGGFVPLPVEGGAGGDGGAASAGEPSSGGSATLGGAAPEGGGAGGVGDSEPDYTESYLLDDMEDGDSGLIPTNGDWYVIRDMSAGVITPPYGEPFTMTPLMPPRGESQSAAQVQVAGFQGWGAAFGFDFVYLNMLRQPYSVKGYEAVRFWAWASKRAELKLQAPNADTDPLGNLCSGTTGDNACYAHFAQSFTVGPEWREVTIPFAELRQEGVGRRAESFDEERVFSLFFAIGPKQELSVAIDDVTLVK